MVSSGLLRILMIFILLANVQGFTLSDLLLPKRCPRIRETCDFPERNICKKDKNCPGNMKCCIFSCGKKCLDLKQDICSLPKDPGPCFALFHRWWYDKKNDTCHSFVYGGCQGNNNNFQSKDLCLNMCSKKRECPQIEVPYEIKEMDQCTRSRRCPWKKCCQFNCTRNCVTPKENICSLPQVVGPCLALLPRWWYDKETQVCSKFMYGSCQGNNNNFQSESTCKDFCLKKCDYSQDNQMCY